MENTVLFSNTISFIIHVLTENQYYQKNLGEWKTYLNTLPVVWVLLCIVQSCFVSDHHFAVNNRIGKAIK